MYMTVVHENDTLFVKALAFAVNAHQGQYRHYSKQEFVYHPVRVSERVLNHFSSHEDIAVLRAAAVLHDVIEDTWVTYTDVEQHFEAPIPRIVSELTEDKSLPKPERTKKYRDQLKQASEHAAIIKLMDIADNAEDAMPDQERYKSYLEKSIATINVLSAPSKAFKSQKKRVLDSLNAKKQSIDG
jgi:guanosine-3',5'-bis(diphosphate) 3'-pyrophosphohydrolase